MTMETVSYDPGGLIAGDYPVAHRPVTIASGQVLARGTVLGHHTANDNYLTSLAAAEDGSEDPAAVLAEDVDSTGGAVDAPAYFSGEFASDKLVFGTGHTATTVDAAWRIAGKPLFVRTRV